jgi:4-diphosphocytidyl-2-C-methyl-D-erythritol kinase
MTEVRAFASAKVNLYLRILGRRPDGYHDLQTLFQAVDLHDVLDVRREGAGIQLVVEGDDTGPVGENLVVRAARAYLAAAGLSGEGLRMRLEKRIPVGAGLGGGSSDAAATLLALDRLFPGAVAPRRIIELASGIGSDVPFFLGASPFALGRGRGDLIEARKPLPSLAGVVVLPPVQVSTRDAYRELAQAREGSRISTSVVPVALTDWDQMAAGSANDFEVVVCRAHPPVADALVALRATAPLVALVSGSGSASFALYHTEGGAEKAAAVLSQRAEFRVFPVRTLTAWPNRT